MQLAKFSGEDEKMSGLIFGENKSFAMLLKNLMESVKECQNVYGKNKTLLATEKDIRFDDIKQISE